ncbi:MAG: anthranilate phosphoribosyltransferase [Paenibacillus sp.]|nr:anthranilate phosphoribosyltransferase [Paenibacillus sp.]
MITLIKEVGRGKRGARDLSYEEASHAAESILNGTATPVQIGAFLVAERIKMESPDELLAFIDSLRKHRITHPIEGSLDCAGPYDGRTRSFHSSLPTAFVLAACGLPTVLHASPSLPPKWGITLIDVLAALNIDAQQLPRTNWIKSAERSGVLFVPTEVWCPPLAVLRDIRQQLGLRTVYNTAEKLLRFGESPNMAVGVFHGTVFEKVTKLLMDLGVSKGIVSQGSEGSEDLPVDKRTRSYIIRDGSSELFIVDPDTYELMVENPVLDWTAHLQATIAMAVLENDAELPFLNAVLLNCAVRLWVCDRCSSIEEGVYMARHAITEGYALQKFREWKQAL